MSSDFGETAYQDSMAPTKSRWPLFAGCGCALLIGLVGGIVLLYFAFVNLSGADIQMQLRDHPQVRQSIGEIKEANFNLSKTVSQESEEVEIYDLVGSNGDGELTAVTDVDDDGGIIIHEASLRVNGEVIELDLTLLE